MDRDPQIDELACQAPALLTAVELLAGASLWSQVTAKLVPLISSPMHWEVTADHCTVPGSLQFT